MDDLSDRINQISIPTSVVCPLLRHKAAHPDLQKR
jgi:hypothetical protein